MPRRHILTERQRHALLALPTDEPSLLKHYTLAEDDLEYIGHRRRRHNRLGFALQLCALRYPGRLLSPGEVIPQEVLRFLAAQLGLEADDLLPYASREETRHEHLAILRRIYGYKTFSGRGARALKAWLDGQAELARSNEDLARRFVEQCRRSQTILPAISTIERLCADALVGAERRLESRIAARLRASMRTRLDALLNEMVDDRLTRFVWLRQFNVGSNSAAAVRLLERLEFLQNIELSADVLSEIPPHRVTRLRRQGERYFADGLRDISGDRRLAILAVCVVEWKAAIADAVVETHDRIVGKTWREAKKLCDARFDDAKTTLPQVLHTFTGLGRALLEAQTDGVALEHAVLSGPGWTGLRGPGRDGNAADRRGVGRSARPCRSGISSVPALCPAHVAGTGDRSRAPVCTPLMAAVSLIRDHRDSRDQPFGFVRRNSKWRRLLTARRDDGRLWEVAVLFHLRDAFRSGDIWLRHSRRYADLKRALVPAEIVATTATLAVPLAPEDWLADRMTRVHAGLRRLANAARTGLLPGTSVEEGILRTDRIPVDPPAATDELILDLYRRLPEVRITDILLEVDQATGFTDAFSHLRTGAPCKDRIGLLNVLLAEGINLGLVKMAEASNTHEYWEFARLSRWHIESDAMNRALGPRWSRRRPGCRWPSSGDWASPPPAMDSSSQRRAKAKR